MILPYGTGSSDYNSDNKAKDEMVGNQTLAREVDDLCITKVYVASNIELTVKGTMIVSGKLSPGNIHLNYLGHTSGAHARIILENGAKITATGTSSNGAVIKAYGFIYDDIGSSGTVTMNDYSTLYQPFIIRDYRNGGYLNSVNGAANKYDLSPFNRFQLVNIESLTIYNYGSRLLGAVNVNSSLGILDETPVIISSASRGDGVITMSNATYSYIHSKYDKSTEITSLDIYGGAYTASLNITKIGFTVSTEDGVFPISYHYNITLNKAANQIDDAEYTMGQVFKMLPGSSLTVNKGTVLNISTLSIYSTFDENVTRVTSSGAIIATHKYPTGKAPAMLMVYGTVIADYLGGDVYTDKGGGVVKVNTASSAVTHEITSYLDDSWNSEIRSYKTIVTSLKLHYITAYDDNGNVIATNRLGYVEVGNTYTANATTQKWEPATAVTIPTEITITVPEGCTIETNEAITSIDRTNSNVEYEYFRSNVAGTTVKVLPGAIVTFHMESSNYLYVETGATSSVTVAASEVKTGAYSETWVASTTIPAVYWVPALSISGYGILETCDVTYNLSAGTASLFMENTRGLIDDPQNFKFSTNGGTSYTNATKHTSGTFIKYVSKYNYTLSNISVNTSVLIVAQ